MATPNRTSAATKTKASKRKTQNVRAPAENKQFDALVVSCIDARMVEPQARYLESQGLAGNYDLFTLAGASAGFCIKGSCPWGSVAYDHIKAAIKMHAVKRLIVIDHMDCGAYAMFGYGGTNEYNMHHLIARQVKRELLRDFGSRLDSIEMKLIARNGEDVVTMWPDSPTTGAFKPLTPAPSNVHADRARVAQQADLGFTLDFVPSDEEDDAPATPLVRTGNGDDYHEANNNIRTREVAFWH